MIDIFSSLFAGNAGMTGMPVLFAAFWTGRWWYALPLIVSISLVYGATRHEHLVPILANAYKSALWILIFMAIIFVVIWVVGLGL